MWLGTAELANEGRERGRVRHLSHSVRFVSGAEQGAQSPKVTTPLNTRVRIGLPRSCISASFQEEDDYSMIYPHRLVSLDCSQMLVAVLSCSALLYYWN